MRFVDRRWRFLQDRFGPFLAMHEPEHQKAWFNRKVPPWLAESPAKHKILTWGNHDWCGQKCAFPFDTPEQASTTELQILVDQLTTVLSPGDPLSNGRRLGRILGSGRPAAR
jgi:hypothetical protein